MLRHSLRWASWGALALLLGACDGEPGADAGLDAGPAGMDAGPALDGGPADAMPADAMPADAGPDPDAGPGDAGPGADAGEVDGGAPLLALSGVCGDVDDTELLSPSPFDFAAAMDFPVAPPAGYDAQLSAGAQYLLMAGTAGGSSIVSEAMAFEYLARCEMANLLLSETEVMYMAPDGGPAGITDMVVEIDGRRVGVSVTRAFVGGPSRETNPYPMSEAVRILTSKLSSIRASSDNVVSGQAWVKQILVVLALRPDIGATVEAAWSSFSDADRDGTILMTVVTNGADDFIYDNRLP